MDLNGKLVIDAADVSFGMQQHSGGLKAGICSMYPGPYTFREQ